MKNIAKVLALFFMLTLMVCSVCCLASCENDNKNANDAEEGQYNLRDESNQSKNDNDSRLYTLREAYNQGLLTHAELEKFAECHNSGKKCEQALDEELASTIKKEWVKEYNGSNENSEYVISEDEPIVLKYYGIYGKCAICTIQRGWLVYPTVYIPLSFTIDGVTFNTQLYSPSLIVWKIA